MPLTVIPAEAGHYRHSCGGRKPSCIGILPRVGSGSQPGMTEGKRTTVIPAEARHSLSPPSFLRRQETIRELKPCGILPRVGSGSQPGMTVGANTVIPAHRHSCGGRKPYFGAGNHVHWHPATSGFRVSARNDVEVFRTTSFLHYRHSCGGRKPRALASATEGHDPSVPAEAGNHQPLPTTVIPAEAGNQMRWRTHGHPATSGFRVSARNDGGRNDGSRPRNHSSWETTTRTTTTSSLRPVTCHLSRPDAGA